MSSIYRHPLLTPTDPAAPDTPCGKFIRLLIGKWSTPASNGRFPTMPPFSFGAEFTVSRPADKTPSFFVQTNLVTWPVGKRGSEGMHFETGFMQCSAPDKAEWFVSHSAGVAEASAGHVEKDGKYAVFISKSLAGAGHVTHSMRELRFRSDGALEDVFHMATHQVPEMTEHLFSCYQPV